MNAMTTTLTIDSPNFGEMTFVIDGLDDLTYGVTFVADNGLNPNHYYFREFEEEVGTFDTIDEAYDEAVAWAYTQDCMVDDYADRQAEAY